ncbi:hypothetical protein BCD67_25365 [Oscillatoriales cyanobacterium USR001]|nr:hypothetical protein BCD67_25365 [Oscillatoriales cyanobacterium USR001]
MNIPVILDIIIGLIFIYLSLSLFATEIQELITTVLQWRAEHLKKSIEVLISGGSDTVKDEAEFERVKNLTHLIYSNPIVNNLNQEAKGPVAQLFREIIRQLGALFRRITGNENIFGDKYSGPSYIPGANFSAGLLDTLKIAPLIQSITESRLERFKSQQLGEVAKIVNSLSLDKSVEPIIQDGFTWLTNEFDNTVESFKDGQVSLSDTLDRMSEKLSKYTENCQTYLPESELNGRNFQWQMELFKAKLDSESDRKALLAELRPSLSNVFNSIRQVRKTQETVKEIIEAKEDSPIYKEIKEMINSLPESLKESLYLLAKQSETDSENSDEKFKKFQQEIETWFDRSMDRSAGVYKRNSRGIALLIGTAIAIATNADTLHIVNTLSTDSLLRATLNKYAEDVVTRNNQPNQDNFAQIQKDIQPAIEKISLPIGWSESNKLEVDRNGVVQFSALVSKVCGWLLTGIAISMGASFWFDLLGKILNIRNAGKKPPSSTDNS